jgi:hypothetical protein
MELAEDDRRKVNDDGVSAVACVDAWMVSLWNVVVVAVSNSSVTQRSI